MKMTGRRMQDCLVTLISRSPQSAYSENKESGGISAFWTKFASSRLQSMRPVYAEFRRKGLTITKPWRLYYIKRHNYEKRVKRGLPASPPIPPSPTPKPPPIVEDPDFCGMDPPSRPSVNHLYKRTPWSPMETIRIRRFTNNEEVQAFPNRFASVPFSISYIAVGTYAV